MSGSVHRRAFRASVANRFQHLADFGSGLVRRKPAVDPVGDVESPVAGVRVGAVLHPAVLLALAEDPAPIHT
jgi:hypothetical protein